MSTKKPAATKQQINKNQADNAIKYMYMCMSNPFSSHAQQQWKLSANSHSIECDAKREKRAEGKNEASVFE